MSLRVFVWAASLALLAGCSPQGSGVAVNETAPKSEIQSVPATARTDSGTSVDAKSEQSSTTNASTEAPKADPPKNLFHWAFSKDAGLAEAKKLNGYTVLKFEAEWCGPCQIMKREAFQDEGVAKTLAKAVIVPIDADSPEGQKLSIQYKADTLPTLVFMKPNGQEFGRIIGYMDISWLQREIKAVFQRAKYSG